MFLRGRRSPPGRDAKILDRDPKGIGSLTLRVVTGSVGKGVIGTTRQGCSIIVNNGTSAGPSESRRVPISFPS